MDVGCNDGVDKPEEVGCLNLLNVVKLGVGFYFVFASFVALQSLTPQLLNDLGFEGLGFAMLAVLYITFLLTAFVAPVLLVHWNELRALPLATVGYAIFDACGILPATCLSCSPSLHATVLLLASALVGLCAPFVWTPQGNVMTYNAPRSRLNTYQALFQALFQAAGPSGYLLSYVLVGDVLIFYISFTCISLCGTLVLATIRKPTPHATIPVRCKSAIHANERFLSLLAFIRSDWRAHSIMIYSFLNGVWYNAFVNSVLPSFCFNTRAFTKLLVALGLGNTASTLAFSQIANRFGRFACFLIATSLDVAAVLMLVASECTRERSDCNIKLAVFASLVLGLGNGMQFSNLFACITSVAHDVINEACAMQQICLCIPFIVLVPTLPLMSWQAALGICFSILGVCVVYLILYRCLFETRSVEPTPPISDEATEIADTVVQAVEEGTRRKRTRRLGRQDKAQLESQGEMLNDIAFGRPTEKLLSNETVVTESDVFIELAEHPN